MKQILKWFCNYIIAKQKEKQSTNIIYNLEGFGITFVKDTSITLGCFSSNFTNSKKPVLLWKNIPLMTKERTGDLKLFIKEVYNTSRKRKIPPSQYLDELMETKLIDDVIEELKIKIRVPKNTLSIADSQKRLERVLKAIENKVPPKHFKPDKDALKKLGIKLPISKNGKGLSVDFANSKYLYPISGKQKNIVKIKMTGSRRVDDKLAYKLSGISKTKKYTWHHLDDYDPINNTCTMQLVEKDIHIATYPHIGSVEIIKRFLKIQKYK